MTVTHIAWEQKELGKKEFLCFKKLWEYYLGEDDKDFCDYLKTDSSGRLTYLYQRIQLATERKKDSLKGDFILNKWNKGRKQEMGISYLCKCVDRLSDALLEIVVRKALAPDQALRWRLLQAELRNLNLPERLNEAVENLRQLNQVAPQGFQQIADDFELAYQNYYAVNTDREQQGIALLNSMEEKLDHLYQTYKAKFALERINLEKSARTEIKKNIVSPTASTVDLLALYRLNYEMQVNDADDFLNYYQRFLEPFEAQEKDLDPMERYILCKYTQNALSRALKNGHSDLWPEMLRWAKNRLAWSPDSITEEGINDYLNVVIIGCMCEDIAFVETYVKEYSEKLSGDNPQLAVSYAHTELLFLNQKYSRCLEVLHDKWENDKNYHLFYLLRYKKLMIKTSLEMLYANNCDEKEQTLIEYVLDSGIDSFRRYLDRNSEKVSPDLIDQHYAFLTFAKRIVNIIYDRVAHDVLEKARQLYLEIEDAPKTIARKWLLNVCQRLIQ